VNEHFLESRRLGLRHWRASDLPLALGLWTNPEVARFISSTPPTEPDVRARLARELATQTTHGMQYWPVFLLANGDFVGCCGLRPRAQEPDVPEFGVHLLPGHWGHGYATEAASLVIACAFGADTGRSLPAAIQTTPLPAGSWRGWVSSTRTTSSIRPRA